MTLAPIILFVYNRPEHTQKTLEALKKNLLADQSILYIYSDAPKNPDNKKSLEQIKKVREIIKKENWCKEVIIKEQVENQGLANSIKNGVSNIIEKHGKIIVLEDDLITSPYFLNYMNEALDFYEKYPAVFSISGYCLPPKKMQIPTDYIYDVYIGLRNSSWGWATWRNKWTKVDWSETTYNQMVNDNQMINAFNRSGDDVFEMLKMQKEGKLNIWSIQFTLAHFMNHAVSVIPTQSFVNNYGLDGSGENCSISKSLFHEKLSDKSEYKFLEILYEDKRIINAFYNAYCRKKRPIHKKIINRLSRIIQGKSIYTIKRKIYA